MNNTIISIIVPIYNGELYVERCIKSVMAQTYENWELILINDGSRDETERICQRYEEKDNRIKYYYQVNQGVSAARNYGLQKANGDMITFLDADDWLDENMCASVLSNWSDELEILLFDYYEVRDLQKVQRRFFQTNEIVFKDDCNYNIDYLKLSILMYYRDFEGDHTIAVPWAKVFSRKFIEKNDLRFRTGIYISEDRLFNLQCLSKAKEVRYISIPLYNYYINDNSVTSSTYKGDGFRLIKNYSEVFDCIRLIINEEKDERYLHAYEQFVVSTIQGIIWWKSCNERIVERRKYHEFYSRYIKHIDLKRNRKFSLKERMMIIFCKCGLVYFVEIGVRFLRLFNHS